MKFLRERKVITVFMVLLFLLFSSIIVYALQITVDGEGSDWAPAALVYTDCDENGSNSVDCDASDSISDYHDVGDIYVTNSATDFFLRFDTYGNVRWDNPGFGDIDPRLVICWDIDNNINTGVTIANCGSQVGVDRILQVLSNNGSLSESFFTCDNTSCAGDATADVEAGYDQVTARPITEVRVAVTDLGVDNSVSPTLCPNGSSVQPCNMPMALYFDNGTIEDDDNVPFSGTLPAQVGSGSPTAVTLQSIQAGTTSSLLAFSVIGFVILGLVSFGIYRIRPEKKNRK